MRYAHILLAAANELWAMEPVALQTLVSVLAFQAAGGKLSAEELEAKITKQAERSVAKSDGSVALLPLRGVIANRMSMMDDISGGTSSEGFAKMFQAALNNDAVKAIVIDVDSPGGAVSGSTELSSMIYGARGAKPIIAHVNANAASAAYWVASAADEMVLTPSGEVGSIGVYGIHDDVSKALEAAGITKTIISAGQFKTEGNPFGPLTEEAKATAQARVDAANDVFIKDVARNRGVSQTVARENFGRGRMVSAAAAVAAGMADKVATLDETLQRFGASLYSAPAARAGSGRRAFAMQREMRALALSEIE